MRCFWLFLLFIFPLPSQVKSQSRFVGKVVDLETKAPISFTTVNYKGNFLTADEKGLFLMNVKESFVKTDTILLSCIGYTTKAFPILKEPRTDTIYFELKRGTFALQEVVVSAQKKISSNPIEIFKSFSTNFSKIINEKPYDCNLHYREFSQQNGQYVDFVEAFGQKHFEGNPSNKYANIVEFSTLQKFDEVRGVNSRVINAASTGYHPATWQIAADYFEQTLYRYLLGNYIEDIRLTLDGIITTNDAKIYKISFKPKKNNWGIPYNIFDFIKGSSGVIYLNTADYSVEKVEFEHMNIDKRIKLKSSKYKNELFGLMGNINYVKVDGKALPSYIDFTYLFKDVKSSSIISKKIQYYFNDFNFDKQSTEDLANRYHTVITKDYPYRGMSFSKTLKFSGNPVYNPVFWKGQTSYPSFWDMTKVEIDFNNQNLNLEQEFKNFSNQIIEEK
jgi:hypothetical protein